MQPIVHGLKQKYAACLSVDSINFHGKDPAIETLNPLGSPDFFLLDSAGKILYRWLGRVEPEEFDEVLKPLCS